MLGPGAPRGGGEAPRIAVCPSQRAALIYLLGEERREQLRRAVLQRVLALEGVELAMWLERGSAGQRAGA